MMGGNSRLGALSLRVEFCELLLFFLVEFGKVPSALALELKLF